MILNKKFRAEFEALPVLNADPLLSRVRFLTLLVVTFRQRPF